MEDYILGFIDCAQHSFEQNNGVNLIDIDLKIKVNKIKNSSAYRVISKVKVESKLVSSIDRDQPDEYDEVFETDWFDWSEIDGVAKLQTYLNDMFEKMSSIGVE